MEKIVALDHREACDIWAKRFADPALMANRDAAITRWKMANVAAQLPLDPKTRFLDVGPGDGALFREIDGKVAQRVGVDPSKSASEKLGALFNGVPDVEFVVGSAEEIPYPDGSFDIAVMNGVLLILPDEKAARRSLAELVRVCAPGGTIFLGEVPFRDELRRGMAAHLVRKFWEVGFRAFLRSLYNTYLRPVFRGEPIVVFPPKTLHFSAEQIESFCQPLGCAVECRRHQEPRRPSGTRNDYILTLKR